MTTEHTRKLQTGFTLMEVLVSLAIFAVCAATLLKQSGQTLRQANALETRTLANWIAENRLEALRLEPSKLKPSKDTEVHQFANRRWQVDTQILSTKVPTLYRIVVSIREDGVDNPSMYSLDGFIGTH